MHERILIRVVCVDDPDMRFGISVNGEKAPFPPQAGEETERKRVEAERIRAEKEARVRLEQARLQSLLDDIDKWQRAEQIRAYVSDVRRRVRQARGPKGQANIQEWVEWALSHADRMDPMVSHEPTALDE